MDHHRLPLHPEWRAHLDAWLNAPVIGDDLYSYLAVSLLRTLVIVAALTALVRVSQAAAVMLPPPLSFGNLGYWLRYWFLLAVRRDRALKIGGLLFSIMFALQVLLGQDGSLSDLTWYLLLTYTGLLLVFIGVARWATRHRLPLEAPHV